MKRRTEEIIKDIALVKQMCFICGFTLVFGLILFGCNNARNRQKIEIVSPEPITKIVKKDSIKRDLVDYLEIKKFYENGYYLDLTRLTNQFFEFDRNSPYTDSVKKIANEFKVNINKIKQKKESLSKLSAFDYFNFLDLPKLDSINGDNYEITEHNYKLDFFEFDKKIFNSKWDENWYLSKQYAKDFICLTVCHFRDCENSLVLYSIDNAFKIIDKNEIYQNGCYEDPVPNFKYKRYLVNEDNRSSVCYFHANNTFTVIDRTYFSLKDTKTNKIKIEIGNETNITYKIDSIGKFQEIENKGFTKEYVEPLYKVPI